MDSSSLPTPSDEPPSYRLANLLGTVIGSFTLIWPFYVTISYSSSEFLPESVERSQIIHSRQ